jgi:hypothetical protein|eukprot:COSAG06_NODE_23113_length_702_cov_0.981758_2_plen_126_part_00
MVIAFTWAWDSAELLSKSMSWRDQAAHALLLLGGTGIFLFNLLFEIPHFLSFEREPSVVAETRGIWECVQDANSPLWAKRLPFFFCYYAGASWSATALAYRFGRDSRGLSRSQKKVPMEFVKKQS